MNLVEAVQLNLMRFSLVGASVLSVVCIFLWFRQHEFHPLSTMMDIFRRQSRFGQVFAILFIFVFVVYGSTKQIQRRGPIRVDVVQPTEGGLDDAIGDAGGFDVTLNWTNGVPLVVEAAGTPSLDNLVWSILGEWQLEEDETNVTIRLPLLGASGFYDVRSKVDSDEDGISDLVEERIVGTSATNADADGDGLLDGEELSAGSDPFRGDSDDDGLDDLLERFGYLTNPNSPDTDGDGLPDAWEVANGLDPLSGVDVDGAEGDPDEDGISNLDEYLAGTNPIVSDAMARTAESNEVFYSDGAEWVELTGDLASGVIKRQNSTVTIPKGTKAFVGVFLYSEEYPTYTGQASQWNDSVTWDITAPGNASISDVIRVNDEDGSWAAAESCNIGMYYPVVLKGGGVMSASANSDLTITVRLGVMNVADGDYWTTVIVGFFPLEVVQENWPVGTGFNRMTDNGNRIRKRLTEEGDAFITGEPSMADVWARFAELPWWVDVRWSLQLTRSRSERPVSDNRTVAAETYWGEDEYNVKDKLGVIIGGNAVVSYTIAGLYTGTANFSIKGKNPTDGAVRSYINGVVPASTSGYAWKIAKHESRQGTRWYNQFNTGADNGLPNKGMGVDNHGWGIGQITNYRSASGDLVSVNVVWDWHANVDAMAAKLASALADTNRFLGYYRTAYGRLPGWREPAGRTIQTEHVSGEMWSVVTLYNGATGIPSQTAGNHSGFHSPLEFVRRTGVWNYHKNTTNPEYVSQVVGAGRAQGSTE